MTTSLTKRAFEKDAIKGHTPDAIPSARPDTLENALEFMNVTGMTRIESFQTFWHPIGGSFGDWCQIYRVLKQKQKPEANWESWILDEENGSFRLTKDTDDEKCRAVQMVDNEDMFWYFWDYDTGTKKRMNGRAARQIEAGYQWIKQNNYEIDTVLRSGVNATEGIYACMPNSYKLSYSAQPAAQKDKQHICVYQIKAKTGSRRLLDRFPPETTAAKVRPGSFMEVYLLGSVETQTEIVMDFWVKGGRTHFQQVWAPSVIRFTINSAVLDNRKASEREIRTLWEEKKLFRVGQNGNVELSAHARQIKQYLLSLSNHERTETSRDSSSCKLAIMNYMQELRTQSEGISTEMALSATTEHFGPHFFTVFPTEQRFRKDFLQQYNEAFVVSYDYVPFDLDDMMERTERLFDRFRIAKESADQYCLNYIFDPQGKTISFCPLYCGNPDQPCREFPLDGFSSPRNEDQNFRARVTQHRNSVALRSRSFQMRDVKEVLVEDAVFDIAIKNTRELDNHVILSAFPFDVDHVYVFRAGSVARVDRKNCLKFLMKIAHLLPKEVNNYEILSVETYANGRVQYNCRRRGETTASMESLQEEIERDILSSFSGMGEMTRRTDTVGWSVELVDIRMC